MNGWFSSTSNWIKKQYFNGAHLLDTMTQGDKMDQGDIFLFGIKFTGDKRVQALQLYQSVLWITYRENINFEGFQQVKSDVGWGCMLRVGQMMLAQTLRIQKGECFYLDEKWLEGVIWDFIDKDGSFCIERLSKIGETLINKKPSQWYSAFDIAAVMKQAIIRKTKNSLSSPKQISLDLQTIITTSQFSLKNIYSQLATNQNFSKHHQYKIKPCLLIIICRLGYQKAEQQLLTDLISILKYEKNCVGILGGRPGKAHYIFGTTDKSFIYLDPHCVKNQRSLDSFMCGTLFSMPHQKIDPSLGICFYFKNFTEMFYTHERLKNINSSLIYCHVDENFGAQGLELEPQQSQQFQLLI